MSSVMREIVDEAVEEARIETRKEARMETLAESISALVERAGWTWDYACDILEVTQEERNVLRSMTTPS